MMYTIVVKSPDLETIVNSPDMRSTYLTDNLADALAFRDDLMFEFGKKYSATYKVMQLIEVDD